MRFVSVAIGLSPKAVWHGDFESEIEFDRKCSLCSRNFYSQIHEQPRLAFRDEDIRKFRKGKVAPPPVAKGADLTAYHIDLIRWLEAQNATGFRSFPIGQIEPHGIGLPDYRVIEITGTYQAKCRQDAEEQRCPECKYSSGLSKRPGPMESWSGHDFVQNKAITGDIFLNEAIANKLKLKWPTFFREDSQHIPILECPLEELQHQAHLTPNNRTCRAQMD